MCEGMRYKRFGNKIMMRLDEGEEVVETLKRFCKNMGIRLGLITGIGAVNKATIGFFDVENNEYHTKELVGNFEVAPLYGNISTMNDEVYLHIHVNLCDSEHKSFGGHLSSAVVSATFEAFIDVIDGELKRVFDEKIGLNLLRFE